MHDIYFKVLFKAIRLISKGRKFNNIAFLASLYRMLDFVRNFQYVKFIYV